jgi:hypothetical protein
LCVDSMTHNDNCFYCLRSSGTHFTCASVVNSSWHRPIVFAAVLCPANSVGTNVPSGCSCNAGFSGSVTATTTAPFFTSSCTGAPGECCLVLVECARVTRQFLFCFVFSNLLPSEILWAHLFAAVSCPASSNGANVSSGCTCNAGFWGTITATTTSPFFTNTCTGLSSMCVRLSLIFHFLSSTEIRKKSSNQNYSVIIASYSFCWCVWDLPISFSPPRSEAESLRN